MSGFSADKHERTDQVMEFFHPATCLEDDEIWLYMTLQQGKSLERVEMNGNIGRLHDRLNTVLTRDSDSFHLVRDRNKTILEGFLLDIISYHYDLGP